MEITHSDLIGFLLFVFGLTMLIRGKIQVAVGVGGPGALNANWKPMVSRNENFTGWFARLAGLLIMVMGYLIPHFLPNTEVLFIL